MQFVALLIGVALVVVVRVSDAAVANLGTYDCTEVDPIRAGDHEGAFTQRHIVFS